jgi:hypothetical protein
MERLGEVGKNGNGLGVPLQTCYKMCRMICISNCTDSRDILEHAPGHLKKLRYAGNNMWRRVTERRKPTPGMLTYYTEAMLYQKLVININVFDGRMVTGIVDMR